MDEVFVSEAIGDVVERARRAWAITGADYGFVLLVVSLKLVVPVVKPLIAALVDEYPPPRYEFQCCARPGTDDVAELVVTDTEHAFTKRVRAPKLARAISSPI